jgi:transaldolase
MLVGMSMTTPLLSLIASGTKLWLDTVDPDQVARNRAWGATGATSNPLIAADLIKTGRYDDEIRRLLRDGSALMAEGIRKFADPQKALLAIISEKRLLHAQQMAGQARR